MRIKSFFENSVVKMIIALAVVGAVSGIVLVFTFNYAMPRIEANIKEATDQAIRDIFSDVSRVDEAEEKDVFKVFGDNEQLIGYAFLAEGNGYQGVIRLIVGINGDISSLKGIEVLESQETPGLGAEISGTKFKKQFAGLPVTHIIEYVKNKKPEQPYQIEAITGATISSRAVVNILNKRIEEIREMSK